MALDFKSSVSKINKPTNPMKKLIPLFAVFLSGCLPENRFWWSPNGQEAAVLSDGALYLVKPDGGLGSPVQGGSADKTVTPKALSWRPDGSGFVLCRERKIASWNEVAKLIPAAEASKVELLAHALPALLEGAEKLSAQPADAETLLTSVVSGDGDILTALLLAYQTNKTSVGALLQKLPKGAELVESLNGDDSSFSVYEICLVRIRSGQLDGEPVSLARSLYAMSQPNVSPKNGAVAWLQTGNKNSSVEVSTLDGKERLTVCKSTKATFDWSPDGRSLVFAAPVGGNGDSLTKIQKSTVIQESGALATSGEGTVPTPVDMGMAILLDPPRLEVLSDGRVLISSLPVTLPLAGSGPEINPGLFILSADGGKLAAVPTASGALPTNLSFFTVSPDGKLAAVVESGNDAVAVVDLASGAVDLISPSHTDWQCRTMPAWRSSSELTFTALGKAGYPEWMLWSKAGGVRPISGKWPAAATSGWLEKQQPKQGAAKTSATK